MKVTIEPKAVEFLEKKNVKAFTLEQFVPRMCCGSGKPDLVIYIGEPKTKGERYQQVDVDGYNIYLDPALNLKDRELQITTEKYLMITNLKAKIM